MQTADKLVRPWVFFIIIFVVAATVRYWYSSTEMCFYTDQSRDALVAQRIISGDWQLFGPVVNGRGAIFHGVLYYYVIAPLYLLGQGNPWFVSTALSLFSIVGLIPSYFFAREFFNSRRLAYIVVFMLSVSLSSIETSASFWNLQLSIVLLPAFCFFLLKLYKHANLPNALSAGFFLGLLIQSGFSNIQWTLPYGVIWAFLLLKHRFSYLTLRNALVSGIGLLIAVSSMIAVEFLAWKRGLFAMQDSVHWLTASALSLDNVRAVVVWYFTSLVSLVAPPYELVTVFLLLLSLISLYLSKKDVRWYWMGLLLAPPIIGQLLSNSAASYILTGYESILFVFVVLVFSHLAHLLPKHLGVKQRYGLVIGLLAAFSFLNISALISDKTTNDTLACSWRASSLEELQVVDFTYMAAKGKDFSIDVLAEPYGINMKYTYLYAWYGKNKYGYTPTFIGPKQAGYITENILTESEKYAKAHFVIYEPGSYNYWFKRRAADGTVSKESQQLFYYRQPSIEKIKETKQFGELITVEYYQSQ